MELLAPANDTEIQQPKQGSYATMNIHKDKDKHFISYFNREQELPNRWLVNLAYTNSKVLCEISDLGMGKVRVHLTKAEAGTTECYTCLEGQPGITRIDSSLHLQSYRYRNKESSEVYTKNISLVSFEDTCDCNPIGRTIDMLHLCLMKVEDSRYELLDEANDKPEYQDKK